MHSNNGVQCSLTGWSRATCPAVYEEDEIYNVEDQPPAMNESSVHEWGRRAATPRRPAWPSRAVGEAGADLQHRRPRGGERLVLAHGLRLRSDLTLAPRAARLDLPRPFRPRRLPQPLVVAGQDKTGIGFSDFVRAYSHFLGIRFLFAAQDMEAVAI